jgi:hypothetical protein
MACAIASPVSAMRRRMRKTPIGAPDSDSASAPTSARRMKPNSTKGPMSVS